MSSETKQLSGRLAGKTIPQQVFTLAIWPFWEQILNFMVGLVDTLLAGHMPDESMRVNATAAIGASAYVGWLINLIQMSVGVGATALISRAIGGRHKRVANAALGQAIPLSVVIGLLSGVLVYFGADIVMRMASLDHQAHEMGVTYLRVLSFFTIPSAIMLAGSASMRAAGDTKTPFYILCVVNIVNCAVSCLLVYAPAPWGGHGIAGIAWGTAIAWLVGMLLTLTVLLSGRSVIRLRLFRMKLHWHTMKKLIRIGQANLAESMGMWIGNFTTLGLLGYSIRKMSQAASPENPLPDNLGEIHVAAHVVAIRIEALSFLPAFALSIAASTLAGQYLGLGDPVRAKRAVNLCWRTGVICMGLLGIVFIVFPRFLASLINPDEQVLELAPTLLRICGPVQIFLVSAIILSGAMRGAGDTKSTMRLTYLSVYLIRLPLCTFFCVYWVGGVVGLWWGLCIELFTRGVIFTTRYLQGHWTKVEV